ncbi:Transcriptional regulator [Fructobacillus cardui]|uniref:helix-turn-helix domain-containing protein n=1 Tax=Fructobacillus cardui TaxID=2893170 RepID=UPI002DAF41C2|nr:Transcriptional regulator [Fructobacillus cardui]
MQNRLKELRKEKKLSLVSIEKQTGIKRSTFSDYENGKTEPKLATWQKLADFFGVDIGYLQGFSSVRRIPDGAVNRSDDGSEIHIRTFGLELPEGVSAIDIQEDENINRLAKKAEKIISGIYPEESGNTINEELSNYSLRAEYSNGMLLASNALLSLLEDPLTPTKETVLSMLLSIFGSIEYMNDYDDLNLKNMIKELDRIKKEYSNKGNYSDNKIPWK